jgi:uncharacterized membrane protein YedE/YeeE
MALQHSNAPTAKLGSPVTHAAPPHTIAPAHRSGYLITGGVQSIRIPLTTAIKALVELVALYTVTHVLANPYAEPATGTNGATIFSAVLITISLTFYLLVILIIEKQFHETTMLHLLINQD